MDLTVQSQTRKKNLTANAETFQPKRSSHRETSKEEVDNDSKEVNENEFYYSYQSEDSQHIYFHPLNMKAMMAHFGSYEVI